MKKLKLTKEEKKIEEALLRNEYTPVTGAELREITDAIHARKKDVMMTIRVNGNDIKLIKKKAKKKGLKYQTFITEILHRVAVH